MIEWLTAPATAPLMWEVSVFIGLMLGLIASVMISMVRIETLRRERDDLASRWRSAEGHIATYRERAARARAILDGKGDAVLGDKR